MCIRDSLRRSSHGGFSNIVKGDVASFAQALEVVANNVGVNVTVKGQVSCGGAWIITQKKVDLSTGVIAEGVGEARYRCGEKFVV